MSRFAAVIFDNDGLLLDTEPVWTRGQRALFERGGVEFTAAHKRELIGAATPVTARLLERMLDAPGAGASLVSELHELVLREFGEGVRPRAGALELLGTLRSAGVPVGLASNAPRALMQRALNQVGLQDAFAVMISGEEVARPKPAPDVYLAACDGLGAAPTTCAALEDSPTGVAAAAAAGMFVIGIPYLADTALPGASLVAATLGEPAVLDVLGLRDVSA